MLCRPLGFHGPGVPQWKEGEPDSPVRDGMAPEAEAEGTGMTLTWRYTSCLSCIRSECCAPCVCICVCVRACVKATNRMGAVSIPMSCTLNTHAEGPGDILADNQQHHVDMFTHQVYTCTDLATVNNSSHMQGHAYHVRMNTDMVTHLMW